MGNLDDKMALHTLRDHGFREIVLLLPDPMLRNICSIIWRNSLGAIDATHHFARLKRVLHSNRPDVIVFFVLKPIGLGLGENSRRRGGHVPGFRWCKGVT